MVVRYDRRTLRKNTLTEGAGVSPGRAVFFQLLHQSVSSTHWKVAGYCFLLTHIFFALPRYHR